MSIMVYMYHTIMPFVSSSRLYAHIFLNSRKSGLRTGPLLHIGRAIVWRLKGTQDAILNQLLLSYIPTKIVFQ